nr:hypothetical protein [Collinsella sp. AF08-23]
MNQEQTNITTGKQIRHLRTQSNQKRILEAYAKQNGFTNLRWYTDDGYSGANLAVPGYMLLCRFGQRQEYTRLSPFYGSMPHTALWEAASSSRRSAAFLLP